MFIAEKHFKDLHLLLCYMRSCMCILCLNMRKSNSVERFNRVLTVIMLHEELHVYIMPEHAQVQFSGEV